MTRAHKAQIAVPDEPILIQDRRLSMRFKAREDLRAKIRLDRATTPLEHRVLDISICGCCVEAPSTDRDLPTAAEIAFVRGGADISGWMPARILKPKSQGAAQRWHVAFSEQQRLEQARQLVLDHAVPKSDATTFRELRQRQHALATSDLTQIYAAVRDLRGRLFQIAMGSITLLLALVGAYLAVWQIHSRVAGSLSLPAFGSIGWWWLIVVSALPGLLAPALLLIVAQIAGELARYGSFAVLLQRTVVMGSVLPAYRGWEDAFANYNLRWRRKADTHGKVNRNVELPAKLPAWSYLWRVVVKGYLPPDMCYLMCSGLLLIVMPLMSLAGLTLSLWSVFDRLGPINLLIGGTLFLLMIPYYLIPSRELRSVYSGARSFDQCMHEWSEILHADPPYTGHLLAGETKQSG